MKSIKQTLNLRLAIAQMAVFALFSFTIYRFVEHRLVEEFDQSLALLTGSGSGLVEVEMEGRELEIEVEYDHIPAYDKKNIVFLLSDPKGKVRLNPSKSDLSQWSPPPAPQTGATSGNTTLPDGRPARYRVERFMPTIEDNAPYKDGEWAVIVVRDRRSVDETLEKILFGCILLGGLGIVLGVISAYFSVRRGLRPLAAMGEEVTKLQANDLSHRFKTDRLPKELKPITSKLNELLERMEAAFQREQRFTSNAAHELRTPLAELQAIMQVGKKWRPEHLKNDNPSDYFTDGTQVTERMSRLLETLFTLSRESPDTIDSEKDEFCLTAHLDETATSHPETERISVVSNCDIPVIADENIFVATVTNLLGNALSHSTGMVTISVSETTEYASFTIRNPAPDLTADDMLHIKEPFWRKEKARSDQSHLGLGLSLVENFCRSQKWTLSLRLDDEGQFCATVSDISQSADRPTPHKPVIASQGEEVTCEGLTQEPAT